MCTSFSNGVTQDTRSSVASVGATAAHELGHIFDMEHDDGRKCSKSMFAPITRKFGNSQIALSKLFHLYRYYHRLLREGIEN